MHHATTFEALPLALRAEDVASVLGISRSSAYELLRRHDFPVLEIGRRKIVPRDAFRAWLDREVSRRA